MNLIKKWTSLSTLWKILTIAIPAVVIIGIIVLIIFLNSGLTATTMRLLRVEGTVTLQDASGAERTIVDNIRFSSGDALSTGSASLASIAFDDHKIVTLDENSRAEFTKNGNQMELNLTAGGVFFDVNQPLADDETFDIRTATMTVGIRGTSGYVSVDGEGIATLILTSGHVHITGRNPNTGETKQLDVGPGQQIRVYLFDDRTIGSVDFVLTEITEDMLNQFILDRLGQSEQLRITVCAATGWNEDLILELGGYNVEVTDETEETEEEEATPTPTEAPDETTAETTATPTPTTPPADPNGAAPTATPTATPTPVATGTATPTPSPSPSPTPTPVSNNGGGNSGSGSGRDEDTTPTTTEPTTATSESSTPTSQPTTPTSRPTTPTSPTQTEPTEDETEPQGGESGETGSQGGETEPQGGGESEPQGGNDDPSSGDGSGENNSNNGGTNPGGTTN